MSEEIMKAVVAALAALLLYSPAQASPISQTKGTFQDKFRQLEGEEWPTPNLVRTASGMPGPNYWQQRADYRIDVELDETNKRIIGTEIISYTNYSPESLPFLWIQLDQNRFRKSSIGEMARPAGNENKIQYWQARRQLAIRDFDGGFHLGKILDGAGHDLNTSVKDTMMRIDLAKPLAPGASMQIAINFAYNIIDAKVIGGRGGYECFTEEGQDGNCIFEISQWYPRMAVFSDYEGWHNKQFMGNGEFTLEFGDFDVNITVPADLVVAATGELQNADHVLSTTQQNRLKKARTAKSPVFIVTPIEALANQKQVEKSTKTWKFKAQDVRDFAFAASRKFIWDAKGVKLGTSGTPETVMAMSFYPNEAEPLWSAYSTKAVIHTLKTYSRLSTPFPYPVAQSINGPIGGMEYPMICFNGPRPEKKDVEGNITYTERDKYGLISVIIHEVGHNFFPMWVNSDERQWTWMDEGMNTFLQFLTEREWEEDYPSRRGEPRNVTEYMRSQNQVPIMTNSESLLQFGNNAYAKTSTALNILRETILGRDTFDRAFHQYANEWAGKRPTPYDFFRTMEEVSGTDLDWFWRGWFYSTDHVDISLDNITEATLDTKNPSTEHKWARAKEAEQPLSLTIERNKDLIKQVDRDKALLDWYNKHDKFTVTKADLEKYKQEMKVLKPWQKDLLNSKAFFYFFDFSNKGGLVMPIILQVKYRNGSMDEFRFPAEIWRYSPDHVRKLLVTDRPIVSAIVDPKWETADVDVTNNPFPRQITKSRLELYQEKKDRNRMKDDNLTVTRHSLKTRPAITGKGAKDNAR